MSGDCVIDAFGARWSLDTSAHPWTSTPGPAPVPNSPIPPFGTDTPMVRAPWRDAVHGEGGTLVLLGETPVRLGPVGEVLWRIAASPTNAEAAYAAVVADLGPHPQARQAVDDAIATLHELGLLRAT